MNTRQRWAAGLMAAAIVVLGVTDAAAQNEGPTRGFLNVSFGIGASAKTDNTAFSFPLFGEEASVGLTRKISGGGIPDVTGGLMLTRRFGLAVSVSRTTDTADGDVTSQIPDPAFFDAPHAVNGTADALKHEETWVGVLLAYPLLSRRNLDVTVLAGPAVARVTHEVAVEVAAPSFTRVALTLEQRRRDLIGGQFGVDVRRMLGQRLGVGAYARYSSAKGNLGPYKADLGGFQVGGGARVRF